MVVEDPPQHLHLRFTSPPTKVWFAEMIGFSERALTGIPVVLCHF
jgi:hypothetical protein